MTEAEKRTRLATAVDAPAFGGLRHAFNAEYGDTPLPLARPEWHGDAAGR